MPRDDFRRDLNDAFSRISGSPSNDMQARVRSALLDAPERRGPAWIAGVAAVALAALVVGALFVVGPLRGHQPTIPGFGGATPTPTAVATPSPSPRSSPSPTSSPTSSLPGFVCGVSTPLNGTNSPQSAVIDAVRGGVNPGYDRFVIEFNNGEPVTVQVDPRNNATFTQGASGQTVQLQGSAGLLITIHGADGHSSYHGPTDLRVGSGILEARQMQDFEGVVQWGLGLSKPACYRVFYLKAPDRLVIDVQTS